VIDPTKATKSFNASGPRESGAEATAVQTLPRLTCGFQTARSVWTARG